LDSDSTRELEELIADERRAIPLDKLFEFFTLLIVMIIVTSFKGSHKFPSMIGVTYCGTAYWSLNIAMFVICAAYIKVLIDRYTELDAKKVRLNYIFHKSEYRISPKSAMQISFFSIIAGTLAGMLGIGGGMVINPLLLELGMKPTVVASTTGFTILFTSSLSLA